MEFEPHVDLVDLNFLQFNENLIKSRDPHSQIKDDETPRTDYSYESSSKEIQTDKTSTFHDFIPKYLDDEIPEGISFVNWKIREFFYVVHIWAKDYAKYDEHNIEPILSGESDT